MFLALAILAQTSSPTPSPSPVPTPTATPSVSVNPDFTAYGFHTNSSNGVDTEVSNALVNISAGAGNFRLNATGGQYGFPAVGFPIFPSNQSGTNTQLYTALPVAAITYNVNSHFSIAAGKFAALLGQESPFTYENLNIQRGIGWSMEPTISRGVQAAYTNGPWSLAMQENDAYYGGFSRAVEGLIGWAPSSNTNLQFAFIIPGANTAPNPTVSVGNKAEYDLMFTRQIGKLELLPYVLYVNSPQSAALGYTRSEGAIAAVFMGVWTFSQTWSMPIRYEYAANGSSTGDTGPNADLVGFGPGSRAQTVTVTPTYHFANGGVLRLEYSNVSLSSFTPGLGFGPGGTGSAQNRAGFEIGVMH